MAIRLIEEDPEEAQPQPRLTYAIWIKGEGWLKEKNPRTNANEPFATEDREVAESALALFGDGAVILPFDGSMVIFEARFLEREKEREAAKAERQRVQQSQSWPRRVAAWWQSLRRG